MNFRENIEAMVVRLTDGSLIIANIKIGAWMCCAQRIFLDSCSEKYLTWFR